MVLQLFNVRTIIDSPNITAQHLFVYTIPTTIAQEESLIIDSHVTPHHQWGEKYDQAKVFAVCRFRALQPCRNEGITRFGLQ